MDSFLDQVARHLTESTDDLAKTTIVFPNRRSALFMKRYMQQLMRRTSFMPKFISITYFTQTFCDSSLTDDTELLMILYNAYCSVLKNHKREEQIPDFDAFVFWGRILLNDFNDVDAYLVDPHQIFKNIRDLRSISANYLTKEQLEVMALLWGHDTLPQDTESFWRHMPSDAEGGKDTPSGQFLSLWQILGEIYDEFTNRLTKREMPLAYSGMQSRQAYNKIREMGIDDFHGRKYVFVGFNVLSTSRIKIFKRLKDLGIARFYWDNASELLKGSAAGNIINRLAEEFPMPDDFDLLPLSKPQIEVIASPSAIGQVKAMGSILDEMSEAWSTNDEDVNNERLLSTAVILPDASLMMPSLYSIPESVSKINVTMGISYSSTSFAAMMSTIISMHLRSYFVKGVIHYFYKDVVDILAQPHITLIAPKAATDITNEIMSKHLYNVSAEWLIQTYPDLAFIFTPISDQRDVYAAKRYVTDLIDNLRERLDNIANIRKPGAKGKSTHYYEQRVLDGYSEAVERLCSLAIDYKVSMLEHTFLQMIERTLSLAKLQLTGEPLKGLQIMGVMDTRALDFENVIMLSMNERVFPKRNFNPSLIPASLRASYMLPTQQHEEASYAYQFYRLISRARTVKLIYDSRTDGLISGEMSRYISQLIHLHPELNIKVNVLEFETQFPDDLPIIVHKTPEVLNELQQFYPGGKKRLSASALKIYTQCPLHFYLEYVKGLRVNDPTLEYIDAASFGQTIHRVAELIYAPYKGKWVTTREIDAILQGEKLHNDIERMTLLTLNEIYYKNRYNDKLKDMPGEGLLIAKLITRYIVEMLKKERERYKDKPFIFIGGEVGEHETFEWRINDKYTLNFTMSIDRIDCVERGDTPDECSYRFIDYKTGSDELSFPNLDKLFEEHKVSGIFQLLLYSHAFSRNGFKGKIKPEIYKFVSIPKDGIVDLKMGKMVIEDYRDVDIDGSFYEIFEHLIDCIFEDNNEYPFVQTDKEENCLYCKFASMCNRYPKPLK